MYRSTIKDIVSELAMTGRHERARWIAGFLDRNGIAYGCDTYGTGYTNIEVVIPGEDDSTSLLVSAHHDISRATMEGANDNASSVAVLLSALLYLKTIRPPVTTIILFNDTEEILGALQNRSLPPGKVSAVINHVGSYVYLKRYQHVRSIDQAIILELSGIGDALFVAQRSANVTADRRLNRYILDRAAALNIGTIEVPILSSDLVSTSFYPMAATVIGAIPRFQGEHYRQHCLKTGVIEPAMVPPVWKNIHSNRDNYFAIQNRALDMVYTSVIDGITHFSIYVEQHRRGLHEVI